MDQLIRALALLIDKKIDLTGLTVEDVQVLNSVMELAHALDDSTPKEELNADIIQAIRKGYEEYLIARVSTSYSLENWYGHTCGRTLTEQQLTDVLEGFRDTDVDLEYAIFSKMCNDIITGANKERT